MKRVLGFSLFLVLSTAITPANTASTVIKNPGKLITETIGSPGPIDPATNYESAGSGINELVYETLIHYKGESTTELEGLLATNWSISADGKQYNFTLREGVKFHDGVDFNAYVMKYSLDRVCIMNDHWGPAWMIQQVILDGSTILAMDDTNISDAITFVQGDAFKVLDDYLFQINLERAFAPFIYALIYREGCAISPKAVAENAPDDYTTDGDHEFGMLSFADWFPDLTATEIRTKLGLASDWDIAKSGVVPSSPAETENAHDWLAYNAVGTGPYYLESNTPDLRHLKAFHGWWDEASRPINHIEEFLEKKITEVSARILHFKNGEADNIYLPSTHVTELLNTSNAPAATVQPEFKDDIQVFDHLPSFSIIFMGINQHDTLLSDFLKPASDIMWDPEKLPRYGPSYEGPYKDQNATENPFTAFAFRQAFTLAFNYEKFIEVITNNFSIRLEGVIPNGMFGHQDHLIEKRYIPSYDPDIAKTLFQTVNWTGKIVMGISPGSEVQRQTALLLANSINDMDIGITINVGELSGWPPLPRPPSREKLPVFWLGWAPDYADPDNYVSPFYYHLNTYAKRLNYNNTGVNSRILAAASEQNVTKRAILYKEIEELTAKDIAFIYGCQAQPYSVWRTWITNDKGFDALLKNPMNRRYGIQWLEKMVETTTTSTTTTTTSITTTTTTTIHPGPGFEFITLFGVASLLIIYKKRKC